MLLCDIGNSCAKLFDGHTLYRLSLAELVAWKEKRVYYLNVNKKAVKMFQDFDGWVDLEPFIELDSDYEGLGADRKALCSFVEDGVIVDAGSAVTVDVMEQKKHKGGFIYPGLKALKKAYASISPALHKEPVWPKESLPLSTKEAIGYGMLSPLVCAIEKLSAKKGLFLTGGDAQVLTSYIPQALYKPLLIFEAMEKIIRRKSLC